MTENQAAGQDTEGRGAAGRDVADRSTGDSEHSHPRIATRARLYLLGASLLALAVAFVLFSVGWSAYVVRQRTDELARQAQALARGMEASSQVLSSDGTGGTELQRLLFGVQARLIRAALYVATDDGTIVLSAAPSSLRSLPLDRLARQADGTLTGVSTTATGARLLIVAAPVDLGYGRWLVAAQPTRDVRSVQLGVLAVGGASLLVALVVAWVAGGVLSRRLTTPLVRLRDAAEAVSAGTWGAQVAEEGDEEVVSLARSFNTMSRRVADTYAAQEAFAGDISHELRTPITSIRGFSEAILDGTVADDVQVRRSARIIREEALRMASITETLLGLTRLESGAVQIAREPVDLVALATALRGRHEDSAREAEVALLVSIPDEPRPLGDLDRLLQAASALVGNSIAYTPAGGRVRVYSAARGDRWHLAVDDTGPGIPEDRREDVFRRYTRLQSVQTGEAEGSGLGLAICRRLVELMGGRVWAEDSDLGGARFVIELPLAGPYRGA